MTYELIETRVIADDIRHDLLNSAETALASLDHYLESYRLPGAVFRNINAARSELSKCVASLAGA